MGLNSCHSAPTDYVPCFNETRNKEFKASCRTRGFSKMAVVQNIDYVAVQCVLVINGNVEIQNGDMIRVPFFDDVLKVENVLPVTDDILFKRRKDIENFTGKTEVALS